MIIKAGNMWYFLASHQDNPSSYVKEQISNFIQLSFSFIVLYHGCNGTHPMANIFELISEAHLYSKGDLIDVMLVVHLITNHL